MHLLLRCMKKTIRIKTCVLISPIKHSCKFVFYRLLWTTDDYHRISNRTSKYSMLYFIWSRNSNHGICFLIAVGAWWRFRVQGSANQFSHRISYDKTQFINYILLLLFYNFRSTHDMCIIGCAHILKIFW